MQTCVLDMCVFTVILSLSHGFMSYGFIDNLHHVYGQSEL